jgi:hypothetical protein
VNLFLNEFWLYIKTASSLSIETQSAVLIHTVQDPRSGQPGSCSEFKEFPEGFDAAKVLRSEQVSMSDGIVKPRSFVA